MEYLTVGSQQLVGEAETIFWANVITPAFLQSAS